MNTITKCFLEELERGAAPWRNWSNRKILHEASQGCWRRIPARISRADSILIAATAINATKVEFRQNGDHTRYVRDGDYIEIPSFTVFYSLWDYYAAVFHELVHWTESRRKWTGTYEQGELIAEIGSALLLNRLGLPQSAILDNHNSFAGAWIIAIKQDEDYLYRSFQEAVKAVDYILGCQGR